MEHMRSTGEKLFVPLIVFILVTCLVALIIYPVVSASPKDIGLAVLSLDEGAQTPQGKMNVGDTLVEKITSASNEDVPITWTVIKSQSELDDALEASTYYAALVIPENFTASSVAAQMGTGEQSKPHVIIDQGKNPAIAATVETVFTQMLSESGMKAEIEYVSPVSEDLGAGAIAQQMCYMLTIIISIIITIVLFVVTRTSVGSTDVDADASIAATIKKEHAINLVIRLAYAAVLSLGIGWFVSFFMTSIAGIAVPFSATMLFLWIASFALMMLFLGFFSWHPALGVLAVITVIVCGLTTALLPYELLPEFWQGWLYPWIPERFIADGLAQILYRGGEVINGASVVLLGIAAAGAVLMLLSILKPNRSAKGSEKDSLLRSK